MDLRVRVISALRWSILGRLISQVATWSVTIFVIRLLSPDDYALMAVAATVLGFSELLREFGLGVAIIQRDDIQEDELRSIFGLVILSHLSLVTLIYFMAPVVANFFDEEKLVLIIRVASLQLILFMFIVIPDALMERAMRFKWISLVDSVAMIVSSLVTLGMAYAGFGVWALIAGQFGMALITTIGILIGEPYLKWPSFNFRRIRSFVSFSLKIFGGDILYYIYTHADVVIIGKILGNTVLGYYTVAYNLATLPMHKISGMLSNVALPAYSEIKNDILEVKSKFLFTIEASSLIFFPILWGLSSVADDFVVVLLGSKWSPAIIVLQLIPLIIPLQMTWPLTRPALIGIGRADLQLLSLMTNTVCFISSILIGSIWGLSGVCFGMIIGFLLSYYINHRRFLPIMNTSFIEFGMAMIPAALMALVMYLAVIAAKLTVLNSIDPIHRLYLSVIIGVIVYSGLLVTFKRSTFISILSLARG